MVANASKPEPGSNPPRHNPLLYIQQKLERVLRIRSGAVSAYRSEVVSILDTLDAVNRDAGGLRRRGHLGDRETD